MTWKIDFYNEGVEQSIIDFPPKIRARMLHLLERVEKHGANLGYPHTDTMGDGLFEIRAKGQEGIGRSLFCYCKGEHIYILHAFVKKTQKTPKKELKIARERQKEIEGMHK